MTDEKLTDLIRTDPETGMSLVIRRFSGLVFSIVSGIMADVSDSSEIEDCVTDVFLRFKASLDGFRPEASLKTYIGVIARNAALNCIRNKRTTVPLDEDFVGGAAVSPDVSDEIAEKETVRAVFDEIRKLGHPDSDIVFRKYYLGQSSKTVAASLGMTVSNVDVRSHRAILKLRDKLERKEL